MAKQTKRLTAASVRNAKPGKHHDGDGLWLTVTAAGSRKWTFRYMLKGRAREMGLGSAEEVTLAEARDRLADARKEAREGRDPLRVRAEAKANPSFGELAEEVTAALKPGFRNEKHAAQWTATLRTYARPIWKTPVNEVETDDVLRCLQPIWARIPKTALRVRGRIERVLAAATARGLRSGPNPAAWRGHLDSLLSKPKALSRGHHAAMPYKDVPVFVTRLRDERTMSARALHFLILTAARSGEVLNATWEEFDLDAKVWTIPPSRMKAGRAHRVPLSGSAITILKDMDVLRGAGSDFVFPGAKRGRPQSSMTLTMALRRYELPFTAHGFRSSFRDWCGNDTEFPRELAETALAHVIGDKAEQAYRRSDALERRRPMMDAWADHVEGHAKTPRLALVS